MAAIEIDESELQALRAQAHLGQNYDKVFKALGGNAESKTLLHAAIKKVSPNTAIPEFDQRAMLHGLSKALDEKIGAATKRLDEFVEGQTKAQAENQLTSKIDKGREYLRSSGYKTQEAIDAIEKHMAQEGIASYRAGLLDFEKVQPPGEMSVPGMQRSWDMFAGAVEDAEADRKLLFTGSNSTVGDKFVKQKIPQILAEIRGQTRAA